MNKKQTRVGPKIRQTRPALHRVRNADPVPRKLEKTLDDRFYIYTCQYCRVKFTQNSHFFRHMSSHHRTQQKQATFQCNDCKIIFNNKSYLDIHLQTHHQIKSKSRCDSCDVTFKSRYCLRRHMKLKQLFAENSCLKCQKKFTNKDELARHVKNKHTYTHTMFQCEVCLLKFKMKESLLTHFSRIHKNL